MKGIIFIILLTLTVPFLQAQSVNFDWAKQMGGPGWDNGTSIAVDGAGNIYTTGAFEGTADFDPGPGIYNLTSAGNYAIFISKLDPSGNFIWAKQMGGNASLDAMGSSITSDVAGNIYTTGYFYGTVDFDPGPGLFNISTVFSVASFILKLDASGNFVWAKQVGGGDDGWVGGRTIITDAAGNVYTSGVFQWTEDFDPGPAIVNLDGGYNNIYITKFDAAGNFIWAKSAEHSFFGGGADEAYIALDNAGNIYCTGDFWGTVDFDPGAGVFSLTAACPFWTIYVWKLTTAGNFVWAKQMEGTGNNTGFTISSDLSGNVYTSGVFENIVDFDPGPGSYKLNPNGNFHQYFSKLDANGNFVWAKIDDKGWGYSGSTTFDAAGNIYSTGAFLNTIDFDPGPGSYNLTSFGDHDIFVRKVGKCIGSTAKSITVTDCKGYTLNGYTYTNSGIYTQAITNAGGCDSIITLNLTINRFTADEYVSTCNAYTWRCHSSTNCSGTTTQCLTFNSSGVYNDTVSTPNGCDSIITLHLTIAPQILSTITQSICSGQTYGGHNTSGTYIDNFVSANGCDSIRTLQLTVLPKQFSTITQSICSGQTYGGHSTSGTYIDNFVSANGCDSIRTLQLTVLPKQFSTITQSICNGQIYNGHSTSGTYIDTFLSASGCDSIRTLQLTVLSKPAPQLGADDVLCAGESMQLYPGPFSTYTWQDGSSQSHFTVTQPGSYSVIVSNSCGSGNDEIIIKEGICAIYFPSAFTPNNDGKNDLFKILGAQNLQDYHLAIYNRYGQKVFETTDFSKGWAGTIKGQLQNTGIFVWYCNFKKVGFQENIVMKGTVLLIR